MLHEQKRKPKISDNQASLEKLIESQDFGLDILHPGGLKITKELTELCHIIIGRKPGSIPSLLVDN